MLIFTQFSYYIRTCSGKSSSVKSHRFLLLLGLLCRNESWGKLLVFWFWVANVDCSPHAPFGMVHQCFKLRRPAAPCFAVALWGCCVLACRSQAEVWQCKFGAWLRCMFPLWIWWLVPEFPDGTFVFVSVTEDAQHPTVPAWKISPVFMR